MKQHEIEALCGLVKNWRSIASDSDTDIEEEFVFKECSRELEKFLDSLPAPDDGLREGLESQIKKWKEAAIEQSRGKDPGLFERGMLFLLERLDGFLESCPDAWKPIADAPRGSGEDGPNDKTHPDYVKSPKLLLWTEEGPVVGSYEWYYHEGYGAGAEPGESAWRNQEGEGVYPTHFRPLPAPPREGKECES